MERISVFLRALLAGFMISVGGMIFLASENRIVGALLFSVGLITVVVFGLHLYTGRICYVLNNNFSFFADTLISLPGNFVGCLIVGLMKSPIGDVEKICLSKLDKGIGEAFVNSIFCGLLIYISVDIFKRRNTFLGILVCIPAFILAGFEHSVADMFYFINARMLSLDIVIFIGTVIFGNAVGGLFLPAVMLFINRIEKKEKIKF